MPKVHCSYFGHFKVSGKLLWMVKLQSFHCRVLQKDSFGIDAPYRLTSFFYSFGSILSSFGSLNRPLPNEVHQSELTKKSSDKS